MKRNGFLTSISWNACPRDVDRGLQWSVLDCRDVGGRVRSVEGCDSHLKQGGESSAE